jgi:hypothetical protein
MGGMRGFLMGQKHLLSFHDQRRSGISSNESPLAMKALVFFRYEPTAIHQFFRKFQHA